MRRLHTMTSHPMTSYPMTKHLRQLLRFSIVGGMGFLVDAGIVQTLVTVLAWHPIAARIVSFLAAATTTWLLNRRFTFKTTQAAVHREWLIYLTCMLAGGAVNWLVYLAVLQQFPATLTLPWIGVAAGSMAGLGINFLLAKLLVFRTQTAK